MNTCRHCGSPLNPGLITRDWTAHCDACGSLIWIATGDVVTVKVNRMTDFGIFVELGDGITGLIHISEMADTRIDHPSEVVEPSESVQAVVLRVDVEEQKIGLSIRRHRTSIDGS